MLQALRQCKMEVFLFLLLQKGDGFAIAITRSSSLYNLSLLQSQVKFFYIIVAGNLYQIFSF